MKSESTTHKAEGLGKSSEAQNRGHAPADNGSTSVPQLDDEQLVLDGMMQCLRGLKRSGRPKVANSAREWERIFDYRIKVTMQERQRRAKARMLRLQVSAMPASGGTTSSPSALRIRLSVSPSQD